VKYKNIPAALHNHGHSFVSLMNYFESTYVVDVVADLLHRMPQNELRISFTQGTLLPSGEYPAVLLTSVESYSSRFAAHLARHKDVPTSVVEATLVIRGTAHGISARVQAKDDKGREYDVPVAA
jgi:hypothetical protein